jgi:hypothetical protein
MAYTTPREGVLYFPHKSHKSDYAGFNLDFLPSHQLKMAQAGVAKLSMFGPIAKHFLSNEYGLFDGLLELGVFGLIAYEVIVGLVPRQNRREKRLNISSLWKCALDAGLRGNKNATVKRRLTNGLGKSWSQNRTFG